jgi:hypothetical protein
MNVIGARTLDDAAFSEIFQLLACEGVSRADATALDRAPG